MVGIDYQFHKNISFQRKTNQTCDCFELFELALILFSIPEGIQYGILNYIVELLVSILIIPGDSGSNVRNMSLVIYPYDFINYIPKRNSQNYLSCIILCLLVHQYESIRYFPFALQRDTLRA